MKRGFIYNKKRAEKNDAGISSPRVERALTMNNVKYHGKQEFFSIKSVRTSLQLLTLSNMHPANSDPSRYNYSHINNEVIKFFDAVVAVMPLFIHIIVRRSTSHIS